MSNWAEKYMKKQGWKETGGIGKTLQGRSEPVKECFEYANVLKERFYSHSSEYWNHKKGQI